MTFARSRHGDSLRTLRRSTLAGSSRWRVRLFPRPASSPADSLQAIVRLPHLAPVLDRLDAHGFLRVLRSRLAVAGFRTTGSIVNLNDDGSPTVRFDTGGIDEMCRHLFTWGKGATILEPARLRQRLSAMCDRLRAHLRV